MLDLTIIDANTLELDLSKCNKKLKIFPFDPRLYIKRGMIFFKLARLNESLKDFNKAEELNPQLTPYLWQRGLTYYYLGKYAKAGRQFELDLSVNSQDIEETLWLYLAIAKLENPQNAQECLLPVKYDTRGFMRQIYQVFAGKSDISTLTNINTNSSLKEVFFYFLYAGLYYFAHGDNTQANLYIQKAIEVKIDDYMWYLACVHLNIFK
ncbi:hypothetical protein [Cyanobacterium sp. Dongsha4]|uniref:tetratricopeptide repeat protein n=1 Tax=Cyanobacterium sp. DS4 TaxID=2878255 RepID=UPI002E81049A|nr:hypothetical protein [Cyanobacterium sp. Dongsha4]WVK99063.1 hypothetical protein Dongsha4_10150 [Cyanobacterium sp. Dongsha4]